MPAANNSKPETGRLKGMGLAFSGSIFHRRTLLSVLLFTVCWWGMYAFFDGIQRKNIDSHLFAHTKILETTYRASVERFQLAMSMAVEDTVLQEEVLQTFARGIKASGEARQQARDELYRMLLPRYQVLREKGIQLFHFHTRDAESFLRFHMPDRHGDSLREVRPSLVLANKEKRAVSGFEMGRVKSGFRNVFPLIYRGEHLGSVELSFSFEEIRNVMSSLGKSKHYQLILHRDVVIERLFEQWRAQYPASGISADFVLDGALNASAEPRTEPEQIQQVNTLLRRDKTLQTKLAKGEGFSVPALLPDTSWSVSFVPVIDTLDRSVGYFVSYGQDPFIANLRSDFSGKLITRTLVLFGIFLVAYMFYLSRVALRHEKQALEVVMNTIGEGLYVMNRDGIVTQVNSVFTQMLGYRESEVLGRVGHDLFHDKNFEGECSSKDDCPIFISAKNGVAYFGKDVFLHKEGHPVQVEVDARPIIRDGFDGSVIAFRDIGERVRLEGEMQAKERLLSSIVENIPIMVFLKRADDLSFALFNKAGEELLGMDRAKLLGRSDYDFFPREQADFFTARDREVLGSPEILDIPEEPIETRERGIRTLHTKKLALRNSAGEAEYLLGISEDITELREYRQNLEELVARRTTALETVQQKYQRLLDEMGNEFLAYSFTREGRVTYVSNSVEAIFGLSRDEILGKVWTEVIEWLPEDVEKTAEIMEGLFSGQRDSSEMERCFIHPDGQIHTIYSSSHLAWNEAGDEPSIEGVLIDITGRKRTEMELHKAKLAAEEANIAKSTFLANMSHEIRTPMNGVIGMTEVLLKTSLGEEQRRMTQVIHDSAQTQLFILNDILDFSKIEAGRLDLSIEPFALADLVGKVCATLSGHAGKRAVTLHCEVDPDIPCALAGDAFRVRQILTNFTTNAIKFSSGLERAGEVEVKARLDGERDGRIWVELSVHDNGIGMDAATRKRLFQPFTQADSSTTRRYGGTGLGLVISMRLAEAMGGGIEVESVPDAGSTFRVRLPFAQADESHLAVVPDEAEVPLEQSPVPGREEAIRQGRLILVAEDNETNQEVIREQLAMLGFQCDVAADGREGYKRWLSGDYALVLSDIHMPHTDGYQLASAIRAEEQKRDSGKKAAHTPVLALTANVLKGEADRCRAVGMDGYLAKPVPLSQLMSEIIRWLPPEAAESTPATNRGDENLDLAVFDSGMLTRMVGDNPAIHASLLKKFLDNAQLRKASLQAAWRDSDLATVGQEAHSLKSAARSVGAIQLGQMCEALEHAGKAGDAAVAGTLFAEFDAALENASMAIDAFLAKV